MAESPKIKVMISSRCADTFPIAAKGGINLSEMRQRLKRDIEATEVFGQQPYLVWIHEMATENAKLDPWEACLAQARDCDIFVALYTGHAGWAGSDGAGTVGICQAEYNTAYSQAPGKVFIVNIFEPDSPKVPSRLVDREFQKMFSRAERLGQRISDPKVLESEIRRKVVEATVKMAQLGAREANRGRGYLGPALNWNRQNYSQRQASMIAAAKLALAPRGVDKQAHTCTRTINDAQILFRVDVVPDAMSVATAREMVGQPHLTDDTLVKLMAKADGGPVHVIACHKGVTPTQAQRMLGFPNATVVNAPFGIYMVDPVQAIQLALIAYCSDEVETRQGVERFLAWLQQAEQAAPLVSYARKRKRLVSVLAEPA
jgi:hypothetical protein